MSRVVIIGGGAAGLLAGIGAAQNGAQVTILEKMRQPGKKMLITGKGRCNITNAGELAEIIKNIPGNGRFLNSDLVILLLSLTRIGGGKAFAHGLFFAVAKRVTFAHGF